MAKRNRLIVAGGLIHAICILGFSELVYFYHGQCSMDYRPGISLCISTMDMDSFSGRAAQQMASPVATLSSNFGTMGDTRV